MRLPPRAAADVAAVLRRERGAMPRNLEATWTLHQSAHEEIGVLNLHHPHLAGTRFDVVGIPDAFDEAPPGRAHDDIGLSRHGVDHLRRAARDIVRRERRGRVQEWTRDLAERPWTSHDRPPSWATLTHPLLAYALTRAGEERMETAPTILTPSDASLGLVHDLVVGVMPLGPAPHAATLHVDDGGALVRMENDLPESVMLRARGMPLSSVMAMTPCGRGDVDAAVAALRIEAALPTEAGGTLIELAGCDWIATAAPPAGIAARHLAALATPPFQA